MKQLIYIILILALFCGCNSKRPKGSEDWSTLNKYIGTNTWETDFIKNPIVKKELKRILGADYKAYLNHVTASNFGFVEKKGNLICAEISQEHCAGFNSIIFIDIQEKKMYLYWLKSSVSDKKYAIYGDKPIPHKILNLIVENMNKGWGHVARFSSEKGGIKIELNK
jgi:hypothetical protein